MSEFSKLEYIWLDGYEPTQNMRSKTMIRKDFGGNLDECPMWSFDGSSTKQAAGGDSDCVLKPVAIYPDPQRESGFLVMTLDGQEFTCTLLEFFWPRKSSTPRHPATKQRSELPKRSFRQRMQCESYNKICNIIRRRNFLR